MCVLGTPAVARHPVNTCANELKGSDFKNDFPAVLRASQKEVGMIDLLLLVDIDIILITIVSRQEIYQAGEDQFYNFLCYKI